MMVDARSIEQAISEVENGKDPVLFTIAVDDLQVSIEIASDSQKQQLVSYFRTYTPYELETLLNLKTWGAARKMKVEFKVLNPQKVSSWILMLMVKSYEKSADVRLNHPPVRWPKMGK